MQYKTPGAYIEEISIFPPSIAAVETAIPAFIGYTQIAKKVVDDDLINVPHRIKSLLDYERFFGGPDNETSITVTINDYLDEDSNLVRRTTNGAIATPSVHNMYYALQTFFANGGGPCYIVSVGLTSGSGGNIGLADLQAGLTEVAKEDEVTLIVFPESQTMGIGSSGNFATLMTDALNQCGDLQDRFAIMDLIPPSGADTIVDAADAFRLLSLPLDNLKYGAIYTPNLETLFNYSYQSSEVNVVHNLVAANGTVNAGAGSGNGLMSALEPSDTDATAGDAILLNLVKAAIDRIPLILPPSPLVAGQYARVDELRGVWKAPANVVLSGVSKPAIAIDNSDQDVLNVDTSGKSINAIRTFTGKGTLIWGARTLEGNSNEWRYIPVRRFFNFAEESIKKATEAFVFEPNDANTWTKVRAMIENFLLLQWRAGALQGAKPEQAFFVKVGLGETMDALDILEGRMNVEIGMAVVRPAEFIILRFSHKLPEA